MAGQEPLEGAWVAVFSLLQQFLGVGLRSGHVRSSIILPARDRKKCYSRRECFSSRG
jgi:hypothetical protein